jgi:hypothetical protein
MGDALISVDSLKQSEVASRRCEATARGAGTWSPARLRLRSSYERSGRLHDVLEHRRRSQHTARAERAPRELVGRCGSAATRQRRATRSCARSRRVLLSVPSAVARARRLRHQPSSRSEHRDEEDRGRRKQAADDCRRRPTAVGEACSRKYRDRRNSSERCCQRDSACKGSQRPRLDDRAPRKLVA